MKIIHAQVDLDPSLQPNSSSALTRRLLLSASLLAVTLSSCSMDTEPNQTPETTIVATTLPTTLNTETTALQTTTIPSAAEKTTYRVQAQVLEGTYGIKLTTLEENLALYPNPDYEVTDAPQLWTSDQIELFSEVLAKVPRHLLKDRGGIPVSFSLSANPRAGSCCGALETKGFPFQAVLAPDLLDSEDKVQALDHTIHELAHLRDQDYELQGLEINGSWKTSIDQAMGISARGLMQNEQFSSNLFSEIKSPTIDERLIWSLSYPMWHMIDGDEWAEWVAEGAENYLYGKDYFLEGYGKYLEGVTDSAAAERFYNLLRNKIFDGEEFTAHPMKD